MVILLTYQHSYDFSQQCQRFLSCGSKDLWLPNYQSDPPQFLTLYLMAYSRWMGTGAAQRKTMVFRPCFCLMKVSTWYYTFHLVPLLVLVPFLYSLNILLHEYSLRGYVRKTKDFTKCTNLKTSKKNWGVKKRGEVMCPCCDEPYLHNSDIHSKQHFFEKSYFVSFLL